MIDVGREMISVSCLPSAVCGLRSAVFLGNRETEDISTHGPMDDFGNWEVRTLLEIGRRRDAIHRVRRFAEKIILKQQGV